MRKTMLVSMIVVLSLAGAACGSNNDSRGGGGGDGGGGGGGCTASNATDLTGDNPFTVTIQGLAFHPNCFKANSSSSITIINKDTVMHTFTIDGT